MKPLLKNLFTSFLNLLFPLHISSKRKNILEFFAPDVSSLYIRRHVIAEVIALFPYRVPYIRYAIWQCKYERKQQIIDDFASIMYSFLLEELSDIALFSNKTIIIIPMPSSAERRAEKGFNQCELLLFSLAKELASFEIRTDLFIKTRETARQATLGRNDRKKNLENCFAVSIPEAIQNKHIILIDDVTTTGSTLLEASRTLYGARAAKITCLTLAR
jgi:ComF family protein